MQRRLTSTAVFVGSVGMTARRGLDPLRAQGGAIQHFQAALPVCCVERK